MGSHRVERNKLEPSSSSGGGMVVRNNVSAQITSYPPKTLNHVATVHTIVELD